MRQSRKSSNLKFKLQCIFLALILTIGSVSVSAFGVEAEEAFAPTLTPMEESEYVIEEQLTEESEEVIGEEQMMQKNSENASEEPASLVQGVGGSQTAYANSISGTLWLDGDEWDGIREASDSTVSDFTVTLHEANDLSTAVKTTQTDGAGWYEFSDIEPGDYRVKLESAVVNDREYLLPMVGLTADNRFVMSADYVHAETEAITLAESTLVTDMDAGMRLPLGVQPLAAYSINLASPAAVVGVTYASNVLTFTTAANNHSYTITGSTTTTTIAIQSGVTANITLNGVAMSYATSPISMLGTSALGLTLSGINTVICSGTNTAASAARLQAGIYVSPTSTLTISGGGSLDVTGGYNSAGIGGSYLSSSSASLNDAGAITVNNGSVTASGGSYAAGIGGGSGGAGGTITINSGTVISSAMYSAGIGGGRAASGGIITINGGSITASGGQVANSVAGAGIGGGGSCTTAYGTINITGGTINATSIDGAGIGGGSTDIGGVIAISGGDVSATSSNGAGIGGGKAGSTRNTQGAGGTITISDGNITATSEFRGAGIGGGGSFLAGTVGGSSGNIYITGGTVIAASGIGFSSSGYGIGPGRGSTLGGTNTIQIDSTAAKVRAYSISDPAIAPSATVNGYLFNGQLTNALQNARLDLYTVGSNAIYDSLNLPEYCACFAYTTGSSAETMNIRVYDALSSVLTGAIVYSSNLNQNLVSLNSALTQSVRIYYAPVLGLLSHSNVTTTSATLVSADHSFLTTAMQPDTAFHYDTSGNFTNTFYSTLNWNNSNSPYTENLSGLNSNTRYYYRAFLENTIGSVTSATHSFATLPEFDSLSAFSTGPSTASVSGSFEGSLNGEAITGVTVIYDNDSNFLSPASVFLSSGEFTNMTFSTTLSGLTTGALYYVKVEVSNAEGMTTSQSLSFVAGGYTVTEKYVNEATGVSFQSDNPVIVSGIYSYTGIVGDITIGSDVYVYQGYRIGSFAPGNAVDGVGYPTNISINADTDVYLVYHRLDSTTVNVSFPTGGMDFYVNETSYPNVRSGPMGTTGTYYTFANSSDYPVDVVFNDMTVMNNAGLNFVTDAQLSGGGNDINLNLDLVFPGPTNGFVTGVAGIDPLATYSTVLGRLDGTYVQQAIPTSDSGYLEMSGYYAGYLSATTLHPTLAFTFTFTLIP